MFLFDGALYIYLQSLMCFKIFKLSFFYASPVLYTWHNYSTITQ